MTIFCNVQLPSLFYLWLAKKKGKKKERSNNTHKQVVKKRSGGGGGGGGGGRSYALALQAHFSNAPFKSNFMFIFLWQACFII